MTREERRKLKRDQRKKQVELEKKRKVHEQQHGAGIFGPAAGMKGKNSDNHRSIGGMPEEGNGGGMTGFLPPVEISNDVSDSSYNGSGGGQMQGDIYGKRTISKYQDHQRDLGLRLDYFYYYLHFQSDLDLFWISLGSRSSDYIQS